jgi:MFS family permease
MSKAAKAAGVAWLITAVYYFHQYALRSAPSVMMPQLSEAFGLSTLGVASLVGLFYYGYSPFSLVAGAALDRFGARKVVPIGAAMVGAGALLFGAGSPSLASAGRLLQGAGGVFALIGAVYLATKYFPASRAATLIGATQMFGMGGGSAGQFVVGPMIGAGMAWSRFWIGMGVVGLLLATLLFLLLPREKVRVSEKNWMKNAAMAMAAVFRNPQSILCGLIAGLLFVPTTIFDMVWGVRYLQEARGLDYGSAVIRSATVRPPRCGTHAAPRSVLLEASAGPTSCRALRLHHEAPRAARGLFLTSDPAGGLGGQGR